MPSLYVRGEVVFQGVDVPFARVEHELPDGSTVVFDTRGINLSEGRRSLVVQSREHLAGRRDTGNPRNSAEGARVFQLNRRGEGEQILPGGGIARVVLESGPLLASGRGHDGRPNQVVNPAWRR